MAEPKKLSDWNKLPDALLLKANDGFPFLQVDPESVDPLTGGPGGNDLMIDADVLGAALARLAGYLLAANNLSDLADIATARDNLGLGYLAQWSPTPPEDADSDHVLLGDMTWGKKGGGIGAGLTFELPGAVIPVAETASPRIPILADGTLTDVMISLRTPADVGASCAIDVFHNGVSMFPSSKPTMTAGVTLARATIPTPVDVVAFTSTVSAAVLNPAGRGLTIVVGSA